jgi:transcription elongation factor GreB
MSKAFTREMDDVPEMAPPRRPAESLPPGAKNYFTPRGLSQLKAELDSLGSDPHHRARAAEILHNLEGAIEVQPPPLPWEQVVFGARVAVRTPSGEETTYRIVGFYEVDLDRNWISYLSPLGRALLKSKVGEKVRFAAPGGEQVLEIIGVRYDT